MLEGELMLYIGDQPGVRAPAGAFAHLPGGTIHGFRVESEKARYLIPTTPRHGQFYRAITLASRSGNLPPLDSVQGRRSSRRARTMASSSLGRCPTESISSAAAPFRAKEQSVLVGRSGKDVEDARPQPGVGLGVSARAIACWRLSRLPSACALFQRPWP